MMSFFKSTLVDTVATYIFDGLDDLDVGCEYDDDGNGFFNDE